MEGYLNMKKYYYDANDPLPEFCRTKEGWLEEMEENGLEIMELFEAEIEYGTSYFYCSHFGSVGEKDEGDCGKLCKGYKPRNKKSGRCCFSKNCYVPTNKKIILKLNKK